MNALPLPVWRASAWQRWFVERLPRSDSLQLTQRNVYIVPTRAGWMLGLTLLLLLVASINYQLNLGYLLTFLIAGCAVVGMHVGHNNLRGLTLGLQAPEPAFAGQVATLTVVLHGGRRARWGLGLRTAASAQPMAWADVPRGGQASVALGVLAVRRGRQALPAISAETRFPLGTFRVWCWWRPQATLLVYPAPEAGAPPLPMPPAAAGTQAPALAARVATDEFDGVRPYRRGDPLRWVVWKRAGKTWAQPRDDWVSRDFSGLASAEIWLDVSACGGASHEARLERLCAWVLAAETRGLRYGLRLNGHEIAPAQGAAHQRHCLEALALC